MGSCRIMEGRSEWRASRAKARGLRLGCRGMGACRRREAPCTEFVVILRYSEGSGCPRGRARSFGVPQDDTSALPNLDALLHLQHGLQDEDVRVAPTVGAEEADGQAGVADEGAED